jgi:hypothetical protein
LDKIEVCNRVKGRILCNGFFRIRILSVSAESGAEGFGLFEAAK